MITLKRQNPVTPPLISYVQLVESLNGDLNGSNQVFTTSNEYITGHIIVVYNGQALYSPDDFMETGPNEITLVYIKPTTSDNLNVIYEYML